MPKRGQRMTYRVAYRYWFTGSDTAAKPDSTGRVPKADEWEAHHEADKMAASIARRVARYEIDVVEVTDNGDRVLATLVANTDGKAHPDADVLIDRAGRRYIAPAGGPAFRVTDCHNAAAAIAQGSGEMCCRVCWAEVDELIGGAPWL